MADQKKEVFRKLIDSEKEPLAKQYINRSSIRQDFMDAISTVKVIISKIDLWKEKLAEDGKNDETVMMNALWQSAILHYSRCFTSSDNRGHINKSEIISFLNADMLELHESIMDLRNEYLAHHSGNTPHSNLAVYGVIYVTGPGKISHAIESGGTRTMGFLKEFFTEIDKLFNQVFEWYTETYVQPITNKLGEKYVPIHVAEYSPSITYKMDSKTMKVNDK